MWRHNQKKGFIGQIIANAGSRFAYLALITHIHNNYSESKSYFVEYLVYAVAAASILSWSVCQYSVIVDDQKTLQLLSANRYHFCLTISVLLIITILVLCARYFLSFALLPLFGLLSIVGMLIVNEIALSTNTLIKKESRTIIYYATTFYLYASGLLLSVLTNLTWNQIILVSSFPGLIGIIFYFNKISKTFLADKQNFKSTLYSRTLILMGNVSVIFMQPLAIGILSQNSNQNSAATTTEFLMLLSISGMVAFGFGNYFQFYGREKIASYMQAITLGGSHRLLIDPLLVLLGCCLLAIPASILYHYMKTGQVNANLSYSLILSVGFYAASVIHSQWFSAVSIKMGRQIYTLYSNLIFSSIILLQLWGDFTNTHETILFSSLIKLIFEIILHKQIINFDKRLNDKK